MMTVGVGNRDLEGWLAAVEADDQSGLRSFAVGIRNDQQAVANGLSPPYNSGKVEGTVNIKMIKRQIYGRAGFDSLRKRVTLHPVLCYRITKFAAEPENTTSEQTRMRTIGGGASGAGVSIARHGVLAVSVLGDRGGTSTGMRERPERNCLSRCPIGLPK
jgi:hypothetical protein